MPEAAADLHQFPARDNDFAAFAKGIQHQEHGCGVIVDHQRGLRPAQAADQPFRQIVAAAAAAGAQIELQIAIAPGRQSYGRPEPSSASTERPMLVWMTTPVALSTGRRPGRKPERT